MADFAAINEADLETATQPSEGLTGTGAGALTKGAYEPVNDNELAPAGAPSGTSIQDYQRLYSPRVIERLKNGHNADNAIGNAINGFATGYGDSYTAGTADDFETIRKFVGASDNQGGGVGGLRMYGQALLNDMARVKAGVLSVFPATIKGLAQAAGAVAEQVKPGSGSNIAEDTEHNLNIAATDVGINMMLISHSMYSEATRPMRGAGGTFYDQRIGPVPTHTEAAAQAAQIADHYGLPDTAPTITAAYDKGVLPAEIFHDAKTNPEVLGQLVSGDTPSIYPVQDWTGGEMAPTAAPEGRAGAEAAATPEAAPTDQPALTTPAQPSLTRLRPVEGTGPQTPMQLSQSVEEAVGKVFDAVPASRVAENDVQEAAARKFVDMDPERANDVAMFGATPPKNLLGQMVFNEVLRRAEAAGDFDKVRMLATQGAQSGILRRFGQEVQAASRLGPEGETADAISQVQQARTNALKAQGVDVDKAVNDEVVAAQQITRQARSVNVSSGAWADFIAGITCR